jgi:hypothetical protein
MAVTAHHHEIGAAVGGMGEEHVGDIDIAARDALDIDLQAMTGEMPAHIDALDLVLLAGLGDDDDLDLSGFHQERHGIADGARGRAAAVPAHHDPVELHRSLLNIRHDDERPSGFEQRGFGDDVVDGRDLRLRLSDHGEIEAPGDAGELLAGAGEARADGQRFGRKSGASCRIGEAADRRLGVGLVVGLLPFDHFAGDIAGGRDRHDRIVDEGDAGELRVQGAGQ